jgi:hypothetical protein
MILTLIRLKRISIVLNLFNLFRRFYGNTVETVENLRCFVSCKCNICVSTSRWAIEIRGLMALILDKENINLSMSQHTVCCCIAELSTHSLFACLLVRDTSELFYCGLWLDILVLFAGSCVLRILLYSEEEKLENCFYTVVIIAGVYHVLSERRAAGHKFLLL